MRLTRESSLPAGCQLRGLRHGRRIFSDRDGIIVVDEQARVMWLSASGHAVLKQYQCTSQPLDACLCRSFPGYSSSPSEGSGSSKLSSMDVAVFAVLVSPEFLVLLMPNGEAVELQLPYQMGKLYPSPFGLLIERKMSAVGLELGSDNVSIDDTVHLSDSDRIEWGMRNTMTIHSNAANVAPKSSSAYVPVQRMSPLTLRSGRRINTVTQSSISTPLSSDGRSGSYSNGASSSRGAYNIYTNTGRSPVVTNDEPAVKSSQKAQKGSTLGALTSSATLFSLSHPAALLHPVSVCLDGSKGGAISASGEGVSTCCFDTGAEDIVALCADIICSVNRTAPPRLSVWRACRVAAPPPADVTAHSLSLDTSRSTSINTTLSASVNQMNNVTISNNIAVNDTAISINASHSGLGLGLGARSESPFQQSVSFAPIPYTSQNLSDVVLSGAHTRDVVAMTGTGSRPSSPALSLGSRRGTPTNDIFALSSPIINGSKLTSPQHSGRARTYTDLLAHLPDTLPASHTPELVITLIATADLGQGQGASAGSAAYSLSLSRTLEDECGLLTVHCSQSGSLAHYLLDLSPTAMSAQPPRVLQRVEGLHEDATPIVCSSIAHIALPVGSPIDGANGVRIPLSIAVQGSGSGVGTVSVLLGTRQLLPPLPLEVEDLYGNDDDDDDCTVAVAADSAVSTLSIDSRYFLIQTPSLGSSAVLSLSIGLFIDVRYANSDVAYAFIARLASRDVYPGLLEALVGLMIVTEWAVGASDVIPCLLAGSFGCSYSRALAGRLESSKLRVQIQAAASTLCALLRRYNATTLVFDVLHLVFEDLKLNASRGPAAHQLCLALHGVVLRVNDASAAGSAYRVYYSTYLGCTKEYDVEQEQGGQTDHSPTIDTFTSVCGAIPNSTLWLCKCLGLVHSMSASRFTQLPTDSPMDPFRALLDVFDGRTVPAPCGLGLGLEPSLATLRLCSRFFDALRAGCGQACDSSAQRAVAAFSAACGASIKGAMDIIPAPVRHILQLALAQCRQCPDRAWPDELLCLVGRNDLCRANLNKPIALGSATSAARDGGGNGAAAASKAVANDGLASVELVAQQLRFAEDDRVQEVCRILRCTRPIYLRVDRMPETSDLEHRQKLQLRLLSLCRRTFASSIGRGMLTIGSLEPLMAEVLPVPPLVLAGRVPPQNTVVALETANAPPELTLWPEFHNGVAAGMRVGPKTTFVGASARIPAVTRNWVIYNRTAAIASSKESSHAGVVLALGLQGYLGVLSVTDICDYLTQGHEPTTVAVLVGMAATKLGSADTLLSKTLCLHLPALLPPRHWDIEISPVVQTAALAGLGLLHCGSGHRLMTEFLLAEISRRPSSDCCDSREAMNFSVAWSLGMVLLGKGCEAGVKGSGINGLSGLLDLRIEDRLQQHIDGGKRPPDSPLFPLSSLNVDVNSKSSRVMEGSDINTNVTAPGATIALAMVYIKSNNGEIARRLALPTTAFAIDAIRPDLMLFKAIALCLVMWDSVTPSEEWIDSQVPEVVSRILFPTSSSSAAAAATYSRLSVRDALAAYLCTVAGYCTGIGLVFAGTADSRAKRALLQKLLMLQAFRDGKPQLALPPGTADKALRPLVQMCVSAVSVSLSFIMAGTGDLECLRILRALRWRVDDVNYGSHMAAAMSIGMLFVAGGNASLKRDSLSVACLLMAVCPRYPARTSDNQFHLQALRHLYVLALETRVLNTVDVDTGVSVPLNVVVQLRDGTQISSRAPCLLPELVTVREVRVGQQAAGAGARYLYTSLPVADIVDRVSVFGGSDGGAGLELGMRSLSLGGVRIPPLFVKKAPPFIPFDRQPSPHPVNPNPETRSGSTHSRLLGSLHSLATPLCPYDDAAAGAPPSSLDEKMALEAFLDFVCRRSSDADDNALREAMLANGLFLDVVACSLRGL